MHTLQDFLLVTKAETYLIAVVFLLSFPLFWRWLNGQSQGRKNADKNSLRLPGQAPRLSD